MASPKKLVKKVGGATKAVKSKVAKKVQTKTPFKGKGMIVKKEGGVSGKVLDITTKLGKTSKNLMKQQASQVVKSSLKTVAKKRGATDFGTMMGIPPYQEKAGEEYMNERQRLHFRELLHRWKQQLMEEVDRTVHHMQDEAAIFPDLSDRATQEEEFNLELRRRDRERKLIKKIEEALQKLDNNEYGYCDACGIEIGIRRLEARPTANFCIDCKTLDEIKERQTTV